MADRTCWIDRQASRAARPGSAPASSATFAAVVDAKRNRHDDFYTLPAGKIDLCNINVPVREKP